MSIQYLRDVLPVPPGVSPFGDWDALEARLGTQLPSDYKAFIDTYGAGYMATFMVVFVPCAKHRNMDLERCLTEIAGILQELTNGGETHPYAIYPAPGGILPFAQTDNGDLLFWTTGSTPDRWGVIVNEGRAPEWEAFDLSMTQFLAAVLSRRLQCAIFPDAFPPEVISFEPIG